MRIRTFSCPSCGAPLPAEARVRPVTCAYCRNHVLVDVTAVAAADFRSARAELEREPPPALPRGERVSIAGTSYELIRLLARGESTDVFLGHRARRLTERVVAKVLRAPDDADLLAREWEAIGALAASTTRGSQHFARLLPRRVGFGPLRSGALERQAALYEWRAGFLHTFEEIATAYPAGVDARTAVWLWRRVLELLGFTHQSGWVHGAILPQHMLVHPREHGVLLVGWSCAARVESRAGLPALSERHGQYYPGSLFDGAAPAPATDIAMSARCLVRLLGGDVETGSVPALVPEPLVRLLKEHVDVGAPGFEHDAWRLMERVADTARRAFGPPSYHPFTMPGWR